MKKELIKGQCENCGEDYNLLTIIPKNGEIKCPTCKKGSQNWDTPNSPQLAPTLVEINK